MIAELINTGSELLLGFTQNTHQQWICRRLTDLGLPVSRQSSVPDTGPAIRDAVHDALHRADLIVVTGGLGPTADDLTRPMIADLLNRPLAEDPSIVTSIAEFFSSRNRPMPPSTRVQALVPEGAIVLPNRFGTAPGLVIEVPPGQFRASPTLLVMLPGPPRELHPMFVDHLVPLLQQKFPAQVPFVCRTYRTTGLGESWVEEKIAAPLKPLIAAGLELAYCARVGEVDVRLVAHGPRAEQIATEAEHIIQEHIGRYIFCCGDDSIESVIVQMLTRRKETLAVAESCTGGAIANRITNVPGASAMFVCGLVTYSNQAKQEFLGVTSDSLTRYGAVSEPVAREMAEGTRSRSGATYALAVTGIAGPTGGTQEKPVGSVYIALATPARTIVLHQLNPFDRETFKFVTSQQALELLRRTVLEA